MASLTNNVGLPSPETGRRIIQEPDTGGTSFLGGLARFASQGINAATSYTDQSEKIRGKRVLDEVERKVAFERQRATDAIRNGAPQMAGAVDFEVTPGDVLVPEEVRKAARELDKTRRAVEQGRRAQESMDIELEKFVSQMHSKYPEFSSEIGSYMRQAGFDHYLWREQTLQDKMREAGDLGQTQGYNAMIEKAVKSGYGNLNLDNDQLYNYGLKIAQAEAQAEAAKASAAEARAAAAEGRANSEFLRKEADRTSYGAATAQVNAHLGVLVDYLQNITKATDGNDDAYQRVMGMSDDVEMLFERYGTHYIQQLQAEGASKEVVDAVKEEVAQKKKAVQDLFFGQSSRFEQRNRAYKYIQNEFGLQAEKALPFYMWAKRVMGPALMESVFDGTAVNSLSPQVKEKIKKELMSWDPTRPNEGLDLLAEIGMLAKGNLNLQDLPEGKVTGDHVRGLNAAAVRYAQQIMDPEPDDPTEKRGFLSSVGNLTIAALNIQPGNKDIKALDYALGAITNVNNLRVMTGLLKDSSYKEQALPVFAATRQAAAQILEVARTAGPTVPGQKIVVKNGEYVVQVDPRQRVSQMTPLMDEHGVSSGTGAAWDKQKVNPELAKQAQIMNIAVRYLTSTASLDPNAKGVSYAELKDHYMNGTPLKTKAAEGKPAEQIKLNEQLDAFDAEMRKLQNDIENDLPFKRPKLPISFKSPEDAIVRTVIGEAGAEGLRGKKAVAAVILNRARQSGLSPEEIVLQANQFETWADRADDLMSISEDDPKYQEILELVRQAMAGDDPTNGATHFYAPKLQSQLGRSKPKWDNGSGVPIGNHLFFNLGYNG